MGLYPRIVKTDPDVLVRRLKANQWYVDSVNGNDDSDGDRPEKPLVTIKEAVTRCTNGYMDIVNVVEPGHVAEVNPIVLDKQFVTVRGFPSQIPGQASPCTLVASVNDSYFTIAAQDVVVRDFTIHGGAAHPAIDFQSVPWSFRTGIYNCCFKAGTWGVAMGEDVGGSVADAPSHGWAIVGCRFEAPLGGGGIYIDSNGSWGLIKDNYFESVPYGIYFPTGGQSAAGRILNNRIMCSADDVAGRGIWMGAGSTRWIIQGNFAGFSQTAAMTFNPFLDNGNANFWVNNYGSAPVSGAELVPD